MADEDKPVGSDKPRSNIYTIMLLVTMAAYIAGIALLVMEMQDTANFRHQLMGDKQYPTASSQEASPTPKKK